MQPSSHRRTHLGISIGAQPTARPRQLKAAGRKVQRSRAASLLALRSAPVACHRLNRRHRAGSICAATARRCRRQPRSCFRTRLVPLLLGGRQQLTPQLQRLIVQLGSCCQVSLQVVQLPQLVQRH